MLIAGTVFASLAAIIHLAIFIMESVLWRRPQVWKRFGLRSQADADVVRPMAYNQGFYNLFLALGTGAGLVLMAASQLTFGGIWQGAIWVVLFALTSMVLASVVLLTTSRRLWRAVLLQGVPPLLGIAFLVAAIL